MADQADEPLIARGHESHQDIGPIDRDDREDNLRQPGLFVWLLTFSAGISGLLFGCESDYLLSDPSSWLILSTQMTRA
jgi:SP family myo-inositol transporter-like MFS transporter 13